MQEHNQSAPTVTITNGGFNSTPSVKNTDAHFILNHNGIVNVATANALLQLTGPVEINQGTARFQGSLNSISRLWGSISYASNTTLSVDSGTLDLTFISSVDGMGANTSLVIGQGATVWAKHNLDTGFSVDPFSYGSTRLNVQNNSTTTQGLVLEGTPLSYGFKAIGNLTGNGNITSNNTVLSIASGTYSGTISGNGDLIKDTAGSLTLSGTKTGTGELEVHSGTLTISSTFTTGSSLGASVVGFNGTATLYQTGGTSTYNSAVVFLGYGSSDVGTYNLQNASALNISGDLYVGNFGQGTFSQSGTSTNTVGGTVDIGPGSAYNLSSGTLNSSVTDNYGTFTQTGGIHVAVDGLGNEPDATYNLSGGSIETTLTYNDGTFTHSNGASHTVAGLFYNDADGTYTLSDPNSLLETDDTFGTAEVINDGSFIQSGGTANLANLSGSGSYSVSGGVLAISGSGTANGTVTMNGGELRGDGSTAVTVVAGSSTHTINAGATGSGSVGTLTMGSLSINADTTLGFDLTAPITESTSSISDVLNAAATDGLTVNGGTIEITSNPTGQPSLGYYKIIQYAGAIGGSGIASFTLPVDSEDNIRYVLDTITTAGFVDLHRGFIGDATDDGVVDFSDLLMVINNYNTSNLSWSDGDLNGNGVVEFPDLLDVVNNYNSEIGESEAMASYELPVYIQELRKMIGGFGDVISDEEIAEVLSYAKTIPGYSEAAASFVPEPTIAMLLTPVGMALIKRRRIAA